MNNRQRSTSRTAALSLLTRERAVAVGYEWEKRARYSPRLAEPQQQLEFALDGAPPLGLLQRVKVPEPDKYGFPHSSTLVSVIDLAWPQHAGDDVRRLLGDLPRDDDEWPLEPGRLPLYVCPVCGDVACGAVTARVRHASEGSTWADFRLEDGYSDDIGLDFSAFGPFTFPRPAYREVLTGALGVLDSLATDEDAAQLAHRAARTLRGRWAALRTKRPR